MMAFRFQKRIKIAPGIRLNVSKSGVSTSLGGRGATVNVNSKGVRTTVGIPGSGMSWSKQTGWAGASALKPADELMQLGKLLDKQAKRFNSFSPKANKISANWNKAIETFEGGRGPSAAKFQTLLKRFGTATAGYQKIEDGIDDQRDTLTAIIQRLTGIKFGMFGGALKREQKEMLDHVKEHDVGAQKLMEAITSVRGEIADELNNVQP